MRRTIDVPRTRCKRVVIVRALYRRAYTGLFSVRALLTAYIVVKHVNRLGIEARA